MEIKKAFFVSSNLLLVFWAFLLVILNGFFVAAEFSLVKLRSTRVNAIAKNLGWRGRMLAKVHSDLDAYLSACQLGITLASLGLGWVGEPAFAALVEPALVGIGVINQQWIHGIAFVTAFFTISYLHIVVGELVPKSLAIRMAERIGLLTSPGLFTFYWVMFPAIWVLNKSSNLVIKALKLEPKEGHDTHYSPEELKIILRSSRPSAEFSASELKVLAQAIDFRQLKVSDLMHPFQEAAVLLEGDTFKAHMERIAQHRYSRYPLVSNEGQVQGIVHIKDLFITFSKNPDFNAIHKILRPVTLVGPDTSANELFRRLQKGAPHLTIVGHEGYGSLPAVAGILYGIKPAVVAIVLFASYRIGSRALKNKVLWGIAALAFIAIFAIKVPFPIIVLTAGVIGYLGGIYHPQYFQGGGGHSASKHEYGKALIDDDTPTPEHALFTWQKFGLVLAIGLGIWAVTISALATVYGWDSAFTQMGWFFTKAALLTFGGAYAVLPYVYQGAVEHYNWLTPVQMIDGLALGETTPGPLIMVVTFVGFVGGWVSQVFGVNAVFGSAFVAASIVTFFTFLPSFVFILMGGPFIETTHGNLKFTAPLTAITAAVVGVILNLAFFFAYHVFWPTGFSSGIDWPSLVFAALSLIAIFRFKVGVIAVILASGLLGMLLKLSF